jgi:hypothetical protein
MALERNCSMVVQKKKSNFGQSIARSRDFNGYRFLLSFVSAIKTTVLLEKNSVRFGCLNLFSLNKSNVKAVEEERVREGLWGKW